MQYYYGISEDEYHFYNDDKKFAELLNKSKLERYE